MKAPFPYYGGKRRVASIIWQALDPEAMVLLDQRLRKQWEDGDQKARWVTPQQKEDET